VILHFVRDVGASDIAKGWDETKRERAAETTFVKVDESWLALGEQYRRALIERSAQLDADDRNQPATDSGPH